MTKKNAYMDAKMTNEKYHLHPAISKSGLALLAKSPEHYYSAYVDPMRDMRPTTDAMDLGTLIHTAVLEPERFNKEYLPVPKIDKRTKEGKIDQAKYEEQAEAEKRIIIDEKEHKICLKIRKRFLEHPIAGPLFDKNGIVEASFFYKDKETGVECKCRPDLVNLDRGVILDIKSAREVAAHKFEYAIDEYRYYLQPPHYNPGVEAVTGEKIKAFLFAAWEKWPPFGVKLYVLDALTLQIGQEEHRELLNKYAECRGGGNWPGYAPQIEAIGLPKASLARRGIKFEQNEN